MKSYIKCCAYLAFILISNASMAMLPDQTNTQGLLVAQTRVRSLSDQSIDMPSDAIDTVHAKSKSCCKKRSNCLLITAYAVGMLSGMAMFWGSEYIIGDKVYKGAMKMDADCNKIIDTCTTQVQTLKDSCATQMQILHNDSRVLHQDLQEVLQLCKNCEFNK